MNWYKITLERGEEYLINANSLNEAYSTLITEYPETRGADVQRQEKVIAPSLDRFKCKIYKNLY